MERSHRKDTANHPDPESCGMGRKAHHEALTGAEAGEASSREIRTSGLPTLLCEAEGNMTVNAKARTPADPRGRRPSARIEASSAGTGRPHTSPSEEKPLERPSKAVSQTVGMSGRGESDESVVSKKPANRIQKSQWDFPEAELVEKRDSIKRNTGQPGTSRTRSRKHEMSPGLERVRRNASKDKRMKFTALLHHLNEGSLLKAFYRLETKAAPGVDGVEWQQYRMNLEASRMEYRAFDPWELNPSSSHRERKQFFQEVGRGKTLVFLSLAASKASVVEKSLL